MLIWDRDFAKLIDDCVWCRFHYESKSFAIDCLNILNIATGSDKPNILYGR